MRADRLTWVEHMKAVSEYMRHPKPITSLAVWKARAERERLTQTRIRAYTPNPK